MSLSQAALYVSMPGGLDRDLEVGDLERDALLAPDRAAERLALLRVRDRQVEAALDQPDGERGDRDPAVVEGGEELREALPALAEEVSAGTRQPSNVSPWVSEACQPSLR